MSENKDLMSIRATALAVLVPLALPLTLAGCDEHRRLDNYTAVGLDNPEQRHPIGMAERGRRLDVEVPHKGGALAADQRADVENFVRRYRAEATTRLWISAPAIARGRHAADEVTREIIQIAAAAGVPRSAIERGQHPTAGNRWPAVALSYRRPIAIPPECGAWPENVTDNRERIHYPAYGCAIQRNIAVMADNPRDLVGPQPEDPRSSERRDVTWSDYVGTSKGGSSGGGGSSSATAASPSKAGSAIKN